MKADLYSFTLYTFALLLGLIFTHIGSKSQRAKIHFLYYCLAALPLSLLAGLRYNVGTDFDSYYEIYVLSGQTDWKDISTSLLDIELGYKVLCKLCYLVAGYNYTLNFFLVEYLTLILTVLGFYRISKITRFNVPLAFFLFYLIYFPATLNIMRQMFATGILIFAFSYLLEKKYIRYFTVLLLGFFIHRTIIIGVLYPAILYFMPDENSTIKHMGSRNMLYYIVLIFGVVFIVPLLNMFVNLEMFEDYGCRLETSEFGLGQIALFIASIGPIILLCRYEISTSHLLNYLKNLSILYLPLSVIGYFADWASRLNMYSQLSFIFLICSLGSCSKYKSFVKCYGIFVFFVFYYINILQKGQNEIFPYKFILNF